MFDFDQPMEEPLPGDPLEDPLEDPFEAMMNALGPETKSFGHFNPYDYSRSQLEEIFMDDLGKMMNDLEDSIENSPPIPPEPQMQNEEVELFEGQGDYTTPNLETNNNLPLPDGETSEKPSEPMFPFPRSRARPVGRSLGLSRNSHSGSDKKIFCPVEREFVFPQFCEDEDCEHYDRDIKECTYFGEVDIEPDRHESGEDSDIDHDAYY